MTTHPPSRLRRLCAALSLAAATTPIAAQTPPASVPFAVLHTISLPVRDVDGRSMQELSGLAWDADEQVLYAVSDRGSVFHLRLKLAGSRIEAALPVFGAALHDPRHAARKFNAEGLAVLNADNGIKGDTQLVVALENGPAIVRFTPQGEALGDVELPAPLRDVRRYEGKNKRLESVAVHAVHGYVTAPEAPLVGEPPTRHTLYATDGERWSFDAIEAGSDLKGIEALPDGSLLVLERLAGEGKRARQVALRRIDPASCAGAQSCGAGMNTDGTRAAGNFEGMTRLSPRLLLLASDGGIERQGATTLALIGLDAPGASHAALPQQGSQPAARRSTADLGNSSRLNSATASMPMAERQRRDLARAAVVCRPQAGHTFTFDHAPDRQDPQC